MKIGGIFGWVALLGLASLASKECACDSTTRNANEVNVTTRLEPGRAILSGGKKRNKTIRGNSIDDDDDFVPYQGERFNVFDWMLFRAMGKKTPGNLLISPISVKLALVLLYEGAQDQTAHELAGVMQLPASRSATRDKFSTILQSLKTASPAYTLNVGTRMYVDSNIMTRQRYEAIAKTFYDTDVIDANFTDARSIANEINSWVSNVTDGHIANMIDDENGVKDSLMVITNALFFDGAWRRKYFSPENTRTDRFYTSTNGSVNVPFMKCVGRFYFSESAELDAKILRIPYDGHKFAMYLVLPNSLNGVDQLINDINPFILTRHVWLMQDLPVDVSVPKFKFDFSSRLESTLRELGIRDIFDDTAMLTGIARAKRTSKHLKVTNIVQKTGIEVNENGTLAYAATEIELGNKIGDEVFHANHPFLFYIEDESTGTILYAGKIANPLDTSGKSSQSKQEFESKFGEGASNTDLQPGLNLRDRDNFFNLHFLQALNEANDGNVVSSPANAKLALTMVTEGAAGKTRKELLSALRLPKNQSGIRNVAQRTLLSLKRNENGTEIDTATRLWLHSDLRLSSNYTDVLQFNYGGDVRTVDFTNSQNFTDTVNDWVRGVTRDKISSSPLNDISPETRFMLTSVVYFKGKWLKSFDKTKTSSRCFYVPDGSCRNTDFMEHESMYRYAYVPSLDAQVLEIPYSDSKTSMLTFVPMEKDSDPYLRVFSKDLASVPLSVILASLWETGITIRVPKFTIESKHDLKPTLIRLGIENVFETTANLTAMVPESPLYVTSIVQSVKIEIDEEGTLAVADTEIGFVPLTLTGHEITLDRPFLFMIVDLETRTTLFAGRFVEPN